LKGDYKNERLMMGPINNSNLYIDEKCEVIKPDLELN
jgi:hypothetical protein